MTETWTKTSPQNITLSNRRKFLAVRPSRSCTMWAKYPKNKLVPAVSKNKLVPTVKIGNDRFTFLCSCCRPKLKFGDLTSLLCRVPQEYVLKCVQHDYFSSFETKILFFCGVLVDDSVVDRKVPINPAQQDLTGSRYNLTLKIY